MILRWLSKHAVAMVLCVIIGVAFIVRTLQLQQVPAGFFCDEASIAYDAYSILTTGKDQFGVSFPVFFQSFGDYKNPLFIYASIPFVKLFGLTEFAVRLQSAVWGIVTVVFLYLLAKEWFSKKAGLLAALIAATMPWLMHYNRIGFEMNMYAALFTATVYLFVKGAKHKSYLIPGFIVAGITLYSYQPPKLLVPLLLFGLGLVYWRHWLKHWRRILIGFGCFALIAVPLALSFATGEATARFNDVSILSKELSPQETANLFFTNYLAQLTPDYFITGEKTFITRHFTNGLLPVLPVTLPFVLVGTLACVWRWKKQSSQVLLYWILLYPIAGAVTAEPPFTGRSIIGAPLFVLLITYGIFVVVHFFKHKLYQIITSILIISAVLINFGFFLNYYFVDYPKQSSDFWGWQYGPREMVGYFVEHEDEYDELFLAPNFNEPAIFLKFYAPNDCKKCVVGVLPQSFNPEKKQLFAITPEDMNKNPQFTYNPVHIVYYPDGKGAFILTTVK